MEQNITVIEKICGSKPADVELIIVGNDPNFIFAPQENYILKVLYDLDGNIINVTSWLECANYVNGGWTDLIPGTVNWEKIFLLRILLYFLDILLRTDLLNSLKRHDKKK